MRSSVFSIVMAIALAGCSAPFSAMKTENHMQLLFSSPSSPMVGDVVELQFVDIADGQYEVYLASGSPSAGHDFEKIRNQIDSYVPIASFSAHGLGATVSYQLKGDMGLDQHGKPMTLTSTESLWYVVSGHNQNGNPVTAASLVRPPRVPVGESP